MFMTKDQAEWLAADLGDDYAARRVHGRWCVWCWSSDHACEFDAATVAKAGQGDCDVQFD